MVSREMLPFERHRHASKVDRTFALSFGKGSLRAFVCQS